MIVVRIKAFFLLFSFLGVQLISLGCTITNLVHEYTHSQSATEQHHHDHSHDHTVVSNTDTDSEQESCCVENSSIFLSGIEAITTSVPTILPLYSIQFSLILNNEIQPVPSFKSITIEIRPPPLLKMYSSLLRINIQSFQV